MRHTKRIEPIKITETILTEVQENEMFSIVFRKRDGSKRVMRAKYSLNDQQTVKQLILTDTNIKQYRRVNTNSVKEIITRKNNIKIKKPLY